MKKRIASEITALTMLARTFVKMVVNFIYTSFGGAPPGAVPKFLIVYRSRRATHPSGVFMPTPPLSFVAILKNQKGIRRCRQTNRLCRVVSI